MTSVRYVPISDIANNHQEFYNETKEEIQFQIYGLQHSCFKKSVYHAFGILLLGVPYFIFYLFPKLKTFQYTECDVGSATILLGKH